MKETAITLFILLWLSLGYIGLNGATPQPELVHDHQGLPSVSLIQAQRIIRATYPQLSDECRTPVVHMTMYKSMDKMTTSCTQQIGDTQ